MYAIKEKHACVNGVLFKTFERKTAFGRTDLRVEAGTTGYKGGKNRSRGGRAYISLESFGGDFCFLPVINEKKKVVGFEIAASGDAGVDAVRKALKFAWDAIHDQCLKVND